MPEEKKMDFTKLKKSRSKTTSAAPKKQKVYKEVVEGPKSVKSAPEKSSKQGRGRRSWKKPDVKYKRIAFDTPIESQRRLKELLATKFHGKITYQDELINLAVDEFLKKHT